MLTLVLAVCLVLPAWSYFGYPAVIWVGYRIRGPRSLPEREPGPGEDWPIVSVLVVVFNEEAVIARRIANLLALDYPADRLEIVIASDGSTDGTVAVARGVTDPRVTVLAFKENRGRAGTHNEAVPRCRGEIVVATDADTTFEPSFLKRSVAPLLADPQLGAVIGGLRYRSAGTTVSESEGLYWRYDSALKRFESALGLMHNGCGPAEAIRKSLYRPLRPIDDIDATTILDVLLQGYRVRYQPAATAFDVPPASIRAELKARIRQTSRSFVSGGRKWHPGHWPRHPMLTISFVSHRLLRWTTPYFLVLALIVNALLVGRGATFVVLFAAQALLYALGIVGGLLELLGRPSRTLGLVFAFGVANTGMLLGVAKGLIGRAPRAYQMPPDPETAP